HARHAPLQGQLDRGRHERDQPQRRRQARPGPSGPPVMAGPKLEFWYEFASTYSYPAAMLIEERGAQAGVEVAWRPFLLGPIFGEQGWNDSPFNIYPAKGRYMWRDMERVCEANALPFVRPTVFPRNGLLAARIAVAGLDDSWT